MQILSSRNTRDGLGKSGKWQNSILRWVVAEGEKEHDGLLFSVGICTIFFLHFPSEVQDLCYFFP